MNVPYYLDILILNIIRSGLSLYSSGVSPVSVNLIN